MFKDHTSRHRPSRHADGEHPTGRRRFGDGSRHGFGRGDFPAGRKLSSSELQLVLLALMATQPAHGYELIRLLEEKSGGFYAPSPGMVYPALTYLDETGQVTSSPEGNRKLYTLTDEGKAFLEANREQADGILETLKRIGSRMSEVRDAFSGVDDADPRASDEFHEARHAFKQALMRQRGCGPEERKRMTDILRRATAEILKKPE
ncbi:PadR family transcriptional regulator [Acetobacter sp.]|jgi:DNA-binding PadR family transcriptional regulator|uniref:PadR family transcriptional regulator n=1 Tax=Acetobacter sp. TaxID=440 RepID=UPI0025BB34BA|nr:PadR family transcriptional regulator [Acetobacter sp.]MCH4092559.1 PadR family transcriptional regulator [Acetobacter sp.]MCI1299693.1 PadR family transcriptional regulator [Acetobacter sp.]MCI1315427.1 PadR family transcriptional regulator [Acetobacter sp.]